MESDQFLEKSLGEHIENHDAPLIWVLVGQKEVKGKTVRIENGFLFLIEKNRKIVIRIAHISAWGVQ
jgi:hypothetical protein